ncbi:glycosyltransferase family 4 protein [Ferribacterium limneticum]|uniref:glycosyltransferase family 4 protein n=1 Tax=Ferribacterium limneticum TaxID=76259 RepID=UPI001CFA8870|nr:glycosyltransferase family 4 protein [Ferribacterium limneticum]UCV17313.1 glycosyltransferase family 4 protein [Ferribacterium limneticum]
MIKTVAYVLRSFPEPSETFIADEAVSLLACDIKVCILHLFAGNKSIIHPSAQTLLEKAQVRLIEPVSMLVMLAFLVRWSVVSPVRTLRTLLMVIRHPARWCYFQALAPAWWCQQKKIDFLHAHYADINFQYAAAMSAWSGIPYGVTTHRYDIFENPLGIDQASKLFNQANAVVTISEYNRKYMCDTYGLATNDIVIVHCGIDLDRFAYTEHAPLKTHQVIRLLNVGRLYPEKGQDVLLHALAEVEKRGILFQLDIIGGGPMLEELQALSRKLGIEKRVHFHGAQPEAFVRNMHAESHVFVLPSRSEGLPVACMEALALGTPTIATRITGIPELIIDGVSGLLVEPENVNDLANAFCRIHDNPSLLEQFRAAGREAVTCEFDRRECTHQLIDLWSNARHLLHPIDATHTKVSP